MTRIAFLGLGAMGGRVSRRLQDAGYELTVWNRSADRVAALAAGGAHVADSPAAAAASSGVVFTMLSDPAALEQVVFGRDGVAEGLRPGAVLVDMSTVGPDEVRAVAARLRDGVVLVDAPVRGSTGEAAAGTLTILVGADPETFDRVAPFLRHVGTPTRVGGPGSGAAMKLVANSTLGAAMTAAGEALALGDALGLDRRAVLDVVVASPVGGAIASKRQAIEAGHYPPSFPLRLALKDLRLVDAASAGAGLSLRVAPAARAWLEDAMAAGQGDLDDSVVVETITAAGRRAPDGVASSARPQP